jgi:hypothetical protein
VCPELYGGRRSSCLPSQRLFGGYAQAFSEFLQGRDETLFGSGRLCGGERLPVTNMTKSGATSAAATSRALALAFRCQSTGACWAGPAWGAKAKQIDRDFFNHSFAIAMVVHDIPQYIPRPAE